MTPQTVFSFSGPTQHWFEETFAAPTRIQVEGWNAIAQGAHTLLLAPTGSGKTLAAFLCAIDRCFREKRPSKMGYQVVYVSPLKALAYDVDRNLRIPLLGIRRAAAVLGLGLPEIRVDIRTGDTPANDRQKQLRNPGDILITTPESLFLMLGSLARDTLKHVHTVIIDEIHSMAGTKRGSHLALTVERLCEGLEPEPQRIGLSATQKPLEKIAGFLGGLRPVTIVDASERPRLDIQIVVPPEPVFEPDLEVAVVWPKPENLTVGQAAQKSLWTAIFPRLVTEIKAHRSTILFVNNRRLCERLVQEINDAAKEELCLPHHGSMSHDRRKIAEEALKEGRLRCIVATSSLELGIDMGAVDLVLLVESPGSVSSGLQRVGRAGHGVGQTSVGQIFPKFPEDLIECVVISARMLNGEVESTKIPQNPLDILAQHIVAMCANGPQNVDSVYRLVTQASPFRDLPYDGFVAVLDMLSGRYPSDEFADLRARLVWDRADNVLTAKQGVKTMVAVNAGTIPDRGLYGVYIGDKGPRIGELDEEMVYESRVGETFLLGASTWRILEIARDRVTVEPAPGQPGKMPFWRGDGPGRPVEVGRAVGRFLGELDSMETAAMGEWLQTHFPMDEGAVDMLVDYVTEQRECTKYLPSDRRIVVERFRDEIGDWRVSVLSPFGGRVHAPWALALQTVLGQKAGYTIDVLYSDSGLALRFADMDELPSGWSVFPDPDEVTDLITDQLSRSALFAGRFRENAGRALLLPKRRPDERTPLWAQRIRARNLQAVAQHYPNFPILLETYRECMRDVMDIGALVEVLRGVRSREIDVVEVTTAGASPFSRSLVYAFVAQYLYEYDVPVAERRAAALTLDRTLLRELLGDDELRDLLDLAAIEQVETELQGMAPDHQARNVDALADLVRRLGDLTAEEIAARAVGDWKVWLLELERAKRLIPLRICGESRWVAIEDVGRFRDALGCQPPAGIAAVFLESVEGATGSLVARYCRTHGPFVPEMVAQRYGLRPSVVVETLREMETRGKVQSGGFRPGGTAREWCDPDALRRIRRLSLARARNEVAPVENETFCRFLVAWQGIGSTRRGTERLLEILALLEGVAMPFSDLETWILPARMVGFSPGLLDELGSLGHIVWVGRGSLGKGDGKISIYLRERLPQWTKVFHAPYEPKTEDHAAVLLELERRGASFLSAVSRALPQYGDERVLEVLWDLVWAGQVTNDSFQPLRALRAPKGASLQSQLRNRTSLWTVGGRWSVVRQLVEVGEGADEPRVETERRLLAATGLLERYGIVSREMTAVEEWVGGFSSVYPVFKAREEAGKLRRGHFVAGLTGAQFALAAAVERLRASRDEGRPQTAVLAVTDPANPYGTLIPWPLLANGESPGLRRTAGTVVVLYNGKPLVVVEKGGQRAVIFGTPDGLSPECLPALRRLAEGHRTKTLRIETLNGEPARNSPFAGALRALGLTFDHRGLVVDAGFSQKVGGVSSFVGQVLARSTVPAGQPVDPDWED